MSKNTPKTLIPTVCQWAAILLLSYCFISFLIVNISNILYPFSLENGEGLILQYGLLLADGKNVYQPIDAGPPFIGCNYPPLYFLLTSIFTTLFGVSFLPGRIISFLSTIGIGWLVYVLVFESVRDRKYALIGALIFFSSPYIYKFSILARPHIFSVFLSVLGIYILFKEDLTSKINIGGNNSIHPRMVLGITLLTLATFAKQTAVWGAVAYFCWILIWHRQYIFRVSALFTVFIVALHGAISIITNGNYLLWVGYYSSGNYSLNRLFVYSLTFIQDNFLITALALFMGLLFIGAILNKNIKKLKGGKASKSNTFRKFFNKFSEHEFGGKNSLLAIYFTLVFLSCLLTAREGSSLAYFMEFLAIACVYLGIFLSKIGYVFQENNVFINFIPLVLVLLVGAHLYFSEIGLNFKSKLFNSERLKRDKKIVEILRKIRSPIISEEHSYVILAELSPYLVNPFIFNNLSDRGLWRPDKVIDDLKAKKIRAVCLNSNINMPDSLTRSRFSHGILNSVRRHYPFGVRMIDRFIYFHSEEDRAVAIR